MAKSLTKTARASGDRSRELDRLAHLVGDLRAELAEVGAAKVAEIAKSLRPRLAKLVLDGTAAHLLELEGRADRAEALAAAADAKLAAADAAVDRLERECEGLRAALAKAKAEGEGARGPHNPHIAPYRPKPVGERASHGGPRKAPARAVPKRRAA